MGDKNPQSFEEAVIQILEETEEERKEREFRNERYKRRLKENIPWEEWKKKNPKHKPID